MLNKCSDSGHSCLIFDFNGEMPPVFPQEVWNGLLAENNIFCYAKGILIYSYFIEGFFLGQV